MADSHLVDRNRAPWRDKWNEVIFGHDTVAGRLFDVILLTLIFLSVFIVLLESVRSIREEYGSYLRVSEWTVTSLFTLEYIARLISARDAKHYATSFFGIVDLLAIAPIYLSFLFGVAHSLTVVRSLRLLRVFRILKLTEYIGEAAVLRVALRESARKIVVFLFYSPRHRHHCRRVDVSDRRRGERLHQYSHCYVLGHRHGDHSRLRRYLAQNCSRARPGLYVDDRWLWNYRSADRNRYLRIWPGLVDRTRPTLFRVWPAAPRPGCALLQAM